MLLSVAVGLRAVDAEANAVMWFSKILEELKGRAALPCLKVDLLTAANHNSFHARMLNRKGVLGDEPKISDGEPWWPATRRRCRSSGIARSRPPRYSRSLQSALKGSCRETETVSRTRTQRRGAF